MSDISEYRGLPNSDIRPLRARAQTPKDRIIISVEEFRQGVNFKNGASPSNNTFQENLENHSNLGLQTGTPVSAEASGANAAGANAAGTTQATSATQAATPSGPYRGRSVIPTSYLQAHSGGNLSEPQKIAQLQKIRESAEEYEGFLMAEMIKSMRQSPFVKTPGGDTLTEIAEKPFTAALTAAGGLGLAEKIVQSVAAQEGLSGTLAEHPEIMGPNFRPKISPSQLYKPVNRPNTTQSLETNPSSKTKAQRLDEIRANLRAEAMSLNTPLADTQLADTQLADTQLANTLLANTSLDNASLYPGAEEFVDASAVSPSLDFTPYPPSAGERDVSGSIYDAVFQTQSEKSQNYANPTQIKPRSIYDL